MSTRQFRKIPLGIAALCAGLALPLAAHASAASEVATAAQHAEFSAASPNIEMAHAHLHHTLNCLVGPKGAGFDSKALDPCKGQGSGAIPDTSSKAQQKALEVVAGKVRRALSSNDLTAVKKDAAGVASSLKSMAGH